MVIEQSGFPQVFGRYLLLRRLSRGGMGEVYLAKSGQVSGFEKIVVIKRILPHLSEDKNFSRKFIQEANIAIKLSHVNIVPVLEVGKVAGEFFLALEHVEGRDLRSIQSACYKRGEHLPAHLALLIVRDMLTGLSYAHRRTDEHDTRLNIVHCDVSPPNVLVSYHGEVKIIDFGIAKSIQATEEKEEGHLGFGKFGYMAPEQVLRGQDVDQRTDLYSAGVVLWELLTGNKMVLFNDQTPYKEIARKVVIEIPKRPSELNPDLPKELDDLVMRAVAKQPDERFQSASEFRDAVQLALVKLAPTVTNDTLGEHIQELFNEELNNHKEMLREAKSINMANYRMELTTAMEETVSFAIGEDWQEMTGPILGPSALPKPSRTPSIPAVEVPSSDPGDPAAASQAKEGDIQPTPSFSGSIHEEKRTSPLLLVGLLVSLALVGALIWYVLSGSSTEKRESIAVRTPPPRTQSLLPAAEPMAPPPPLPAMKTAPPAMAEKAPPKPHRKPMRVRTVMRATVRRPSRRTPPKPMRVKPMKENDAESFDALKERVKKRYAYVSRTYRAFSKKNGPILQHQWRRVTNALMGGTNTKARITTLNTEISRLVHLMQKHGK